MKCLLLSCFFCIFALMSCGGGKDEREPQGEDFEQSLDERQETDTQPVARDSSDSVAERGADVAQKDNTTAKTGEDAKADNGKPVAGRWTGTIHSVNGIAMNNFQQVSSDKAAGLLSKGQFMIFKSGDNVYLVYNADGSYASKKLASSAGKTVTISGTMRTVNEVPYIVMDSIE